VPAGVGLSGGYFLLRALTDSGYAAGTAVSVIHSPSASGLTPTCGALLIRPSKGESVLDFPWSSLAGGYALPPKKRAKWFAAEWGLKSFGLEDTTAGRRRMVERVDRRAVEEATKGCGVPMLPDEVDARVSHLRRGWFWGTQAFAEKAMKLVQGMSGKGKSRAYQATPERRLHGLTQADQWLNEGLKAAALDADELKRTKGSDPRKVALAKLLWERTTVSQDWLAEKLQMRSAANVCILLGRHRKAKKTNIPSKLESWIAGVEFWGAGG
jgi:putative transposase